MTPTTVAAAHVDVVVSCARCTAAERERDALRRLLGDKETQLDAERRHSADLERRVQRATPTWAPA